MEKKTRTITLTGRPPVRINEDNWPVIAKGKGDWFENREIPCQSNAEEHAWIRVRQHSDGRAIVYGGYTSDSRWQGTTPVSARAGELCYAADILYTIRLVARTLRERAGGGDDYPQRVIDAAERATVDNLPAEDLG